MRYVISILSLLVVFLPSTLHADLSGTVTDTDGNPIVGALVTATNESDPDDSESVYTDETGFYEIKAMTSGVNEEPPLPFILSQNYPNPFNPSTTIPFALDTAEHVTLTVYNIMGQRVRTLVDGYRTAGTYMVTWNGLDSDGAGVGAGLYLYRLQCGARTVTRKMLLIDGGNGVSTGAVPIMRPAKAEKVAVIGESHYKITVTKEGYQPCFRHSVGIIADADEIIDFVTCSSAVYKIHDIKFVSIPGGKFRMGDIDWDGDERARPVHEVTLDGFEMSIYEITNGQYAAYLNEAKASNDITVDTANKMVIGTTGAYSGKCYYRYKNDYNMINYNTNLNMFTRRPGNYPAFDITWYGAKAFALYYGLDLPTEAEWEYACRAGTETLFYTGNDMDDEGKESTSLDRAAWYGGNSYRDEDPPLTYEVGKKENNAFGLFDMHGNVLEWCSDWYGDYTSASATNPTGSTTGSYRVFRGGCWSGWAIGCRSAYRSKRLPSDSYYSQGFRVVRRP